MITLNLFPSTLAAAALALGLAGTAHAQAQSTIQEHGAMHVTKDPTCGCCGAWVALARNEGYEVKITDTRDITRAKIEAGVPGNLWSCHTAQIDGYIVEGHVPFAAVAKLLRDRPEISGVAVPGMPIGSPGMGDDPTARYDVISFGGTAAEGEVFFQAGR